jgi:hypothetical protein
MDHPTLPEPRKLSPGWLFWLKWVAASLAGLLLGFGILYGLIFLGKAVLPDFNEDRFFGWLMFPFLATLLGAAQWLVLRQRIPRSGWWILATVAGLNAGVALAQGAGQLLSRGTNQPWAWDSQPKILLLYIFIGLLLGLAQLPILWRHIRGRVRWLLASLLGWLALGLVLGKSIDRMSDIFAFGAIPAAFTGFELPWLLRTPPGQKNTVEGKPRELVP